jgi:serine/threonine protein kinase
MGEVYLAQDPRLGRTVALKILPGDLAADPERMQRFAREARAASALNHPNVATVSDVGQSDGIHFIAMEHVEGETIAARIAGRPLSPSEVVDIAVQAADALDVAHAKGITHRDIKPANLMLTERGHVKVLDPTLRDERPPLARFAGPATRERASDTGVLLTISKYLLYFLMPCGVYGVRPSRKLLRHSSRYCGGGLSSRPACWWRSY